MYRVLDGRGTGKTGRLMLLAKEVNGVLVCENPIAMRNKAQIYGLTGFDIISYSDYVQHNYPFDKLCFIDELESFVQFLCLNKFAGYTLSLE